MKTDCLALDLKDDPELIAEYKRYHRPENIWPEVTAYIRELGILSEEIYLLGTHMAMFLYTTDDFSFEAKAAADQGNPKIREWEELMWKFQKPVPGAKPGEKWVPMENIFEL
jgi:L-rhamnose mutarotase